jgi:hypothetical protein
MIFTRFDGLTKDHYGATASALNILDNIAKTLDDNKVPGEQVLFVGNEFHKRLVNGSGDVKPASPVLLRERLNLELDEQERPILPEGFKRQPALLNAFMEVIRDGGIGKVRQMIGEVLEQKVEIEVRDAVDAELRSLRSELSRLITSAQEAMRMDSGGFLRAVQWKVKLQEARQELDRDRSIIEDPTVKCMEELRRLFSEKLCPPTLLIDRAKLRTTHREYARVLSQTASSQCHTELTPSVYGWITNKLRAAHSSLGDVRLNGHPNPLVAWESRKDRDLTDLGWLKTVLSFDEPPLFPPGEEDVQLKDRDYRTAMPRKVEAVYHRAALEVSRRLKSHIDELVDGLTLLQDAEKHVDTAPPAVFQEILQALR